MESQGWLNILWSNPVFIFVRLLFVLAVVCAAEFYGLRRIEPLTPWQLMTASTLLTAAIILLIFYHCRGEVAGPQERVMLRLLKRYRRGGILQSEDKLAVEYWQSMGYMRTGFTDDTPNQEPVDTASFTPEGLELFRQRKFEIQRGIWPSIKRSVIISVNS